MDYRHFFIMEKAIFRAKIKLIQGNAVHFYVNNMKEALY